VFGFSTHRGRRFSVLSDFALPPLTPAIDPRFDVDGYSHFPFFVYDSVDFGPPDANPIGRYTWHLTMLDQHHEGWRIRVRFSVHG
jgi:hypothetical protein